METKLDKLRSYQENKQESSLARETRAKKKSSKDQGEIITGLEGRGRKSYYMGDIPKERWEKFFGKKDTKAKGNKKPRRHNK